MDSTNSISAPRLSIITPAWNGLPLIAQCVESVLEQSFTDWELLISDDQSSDGTREYLSSLKDPRIRITCQPRNLGIFGNLNYLFRQARAPLSQILCQDDFLVSKQSLAAVVDEWKQLPEDVGFVRWNGKATRNRCQLQLLEERLVPRTVPLERASLYFFIFGNLPGNLSNVSLKTHLIREAGWFREDLPFTGDFEFWARAASHSKLALSDTIISHVRRHERAASVHLNLHGEYVSQNHAVAEHLYATVPAKGAKRWLLALHATTNYDSLQRWVGVSRWVKSGSREYLSQVNKVAAQSQMLFGPVLRQLVFCLTLGGRLWRAVIARAALRANGVAL